MEKINVASFTVNGKYYNLKTVEGKEIGVVIDSCPKIKSQIEVVQTAPFPLECRVVEKNGKFWAWDFEEKKRGGGAPRNEKAIIAQSSMGHAVAFYQGSTADQQEVFALAEKIYEWVLKKGGL